MDDKLKILQFGKFFPPHLGGIETFIEQLTFALNKKGVKCDVLCSNKTFRYKDENIDGVNVIRTRSYGVIFSLSISPQLITKLFKLRNKYDILHLHHPDPMSALAVWLVRPKSRIVLTWHNDIIRQKRLLTFFSPIQTWLMKRADAIVATSPTYIKGSIPLQNFIDKITIIPLGIEKVKWVVPTEVESFRNKFPNKKYFVFSLGRLVDYKGFKYLIKSAKYLSPEYQIFIGGTGKLFKKLNVLIGKCEVADKVKLVGKIPLAELPLYYNAADVFCLASIARNEGFGIVLLEAMSVGKPIVSTNLPDSGVSWVNQHKVTGLNVPPKDTKAIAEAITHICNNRSVNESFSTASRLRFEENFTIEIMLNQYISLYKRILV